MPQDPAPAVAQAVTPGRPDIAAAQALADQAATLRAAEAQLPATVTPPRSAREVQGLNVRRDMLRQQLERTEERRQQLSRELQRAGDTEGDRAPDPAAVATLRAGLEVRLRDVDARALQLERDVAATDRALTQAGPEVLAQYEQQRPREPARQGPDEGEVAGLMFLAFLVGMLVLTLARRIRRWRRRGERPANGAPAGVGPDPRIDRLTHAVDAIALEVERIGEGQRFVTQLLAEGQGGRPALAAEASRPAGRDGERTLDAPAVR